MTNTKITIDGKEYKIRPGTLRIVIGGRSFEELKPYQQAGIRSLMTWRRTRKAKGWRRHVRRMKARGMMR